MLRDFGLKLARSPSTIIKLMANAIIAPMVCKTKGVQIEEGVKFVGIPRIKLAKGGMISIGRGCDLYSRSDSNVFYLARPISLVAEAGACIDIHAGVGMSGVSIVAAKSVTIGRNTLIGAESIITDTDCHPLSPEMRLVSQTKCAEALPVTIGQSVFIGTRAIILKGVRIGDGAVVGAGAVVSRDVPERMIVAGNPAKVVGRVK